MKILQQDNWVSCKDAAGTDGMFEFQLTVAKSEGYRDHGLQKGSRHFFIYTLAHAEIFILVCFFLLFLALSASQNSNLSILSSQLDCCSSRGGK